MSWRIFSLMPPSGTAASPPSAGVWATLARAFSTASELWLSAVLALRGMKGFLGD